MLDRGQYICIECGSTIAEYRDFKKPDEIGKVGLANPIEQNAQTSFADFENLAETNNTMLEEIVSEFVDKGQKINAIIFYREWMLENTNTRVTLREAKEKIDAYAARNVTLI